MKLRGTKNYKGQGMVEFALAIPIVLLIAMGIIEMGRLLYTYTTVAAAGREAARYGAGIGPNDSETVELYNDCDGIRAAAVRIGQFAGVQADNVSISHDTGPGTTAVPYCQPGDPPIAISLGDRILVDVSVTYTPIVPLVSVPEMTLYSQNAHTLVKEAPVIAYTPQVVTVGETCDNTKYKIGITNPLGPVVTVTLTNINTSVETVNIKNILVVWDPTSSPILNQITLADGVTNLSFSPMYDAAPTYSHDVNWNFNNGVSITKKLIFSKALKNNVIVRLTLDNDCSFGQ